MLRNENIKSSKLLGTKTLATYLQAKVAQFITNPYAPIIRKGLACEDGGNNTTTVCTNNNVGETYSIKALLTGNSL